MKDFDAERQRREEAEATVEDRDFKIGGEFFRAKRKVRPEVLIELSKIEAMADNLDGILETMDSTIQAMIEPNDDAYARYRAMRERDDDSLVDLDDLQEVVSWLIEVFTGRPTEQPGDSSAGRGSTGTNSTDTSSSPDSPEVQQA